MGIQEVGMIVGGVLILAVVVWGANKISNLKNNTKQ